MKKYCITLHSLIPAATVFALLFGCNSSPENGGETAREENAPDTIAYTYKAYEKKVGHCDSVHQACAAVNMSIINIEEDHPMDAKSRISTALYRSVGDWGESNSVGDYQYLMNRFIDDYKEVTEEIPDYTTNWYWDVETFVHFNHPLLFSVEVEQESYTGGTHGMMLVQCLNFDPESGDTLHWKDLIDPREQEQFRDIGEELFREQAGLSADDIPEEKGYDFKGGSFRLNDNFYFDGENMVFVYNVAEIGAYELGLTKVVIPGKRLGTLLRDKYRPLLNHTSVSASAE